MTAFVVDASFAAAWVLADESHELAEKLLGDLHLHPAYVPFLFWPEMRNLLVIAERRQRIEPDEANRSMRRLRRISILNSEEGDDGSVIALALRHKLTAYDAGYLELAIRMSLPLASMDRELITAARKERVELIE